MSSSGLSSTDLLQAIINSAAGKGVDLWAEDGDLHYSAPAGGLDEEMLASLRANKAELIRYLERSPRMSPRAVNAGERSAAGVRRLSLAYSQLVHWNLYRLYERNAIRQIASAIYLRGCLDVSALQEGLATIVRRHEALRTRIITHEGQPKQEILHDIRCDLEIEALPENLEIPLDEAIARRIEAYILAPIRVDSAPLFGACLIRVRDSEHVLILAMEHMISDAYSAGIVLRDLLAVYAQSVTHSPRELPAIEMQFSDHVAAVARLERLQCSGINPDGTDYLASYSRTRFPDKHTARDGSRRGWDSAPIAIGPRLKVSLQRWCRANRTTLSMALFTAHIALVLRWCNTWNTVVQYVSDGRMTPDVANTVGFFASMLYVRVTLSPEDDFIKMLRHVTEEYCVAYERADHSYRESRIPRPGFTYNTAFNWIPLGAELDLSLTLGSAFSLQCSPIHFDHPMLATLERDNEPVLFLSESGEGASGGILFPLNRFSRKSMESFSHNFLAFIDVLLNDPHRRIVDVDITDLD